MLKLREKQRVDLESSNVEINVNGFIANISVELSYKNQSEEAVEVVYILPLNVKTAVYSFNAKLDGRSITGHCMEKKKAKEVYDNAVKEGHTAILGSEDRFSGDLLHLALGNLPKGEFANLQLKMVQELPLKIDGAVDFTLPTITQDDGMNFDHDWSFQIYYQTVHKPHCLQMTGDRTSSGLMKDDVLMLNLFPEVPLEDYSPFNEIILVVDRSGKFYDALNYGLH
ncbi:Poly [ADP-ribose] polymerase 4 [Armadillidium vulgare]|nr:Poly [ADP-ribose] polymerase 4 [Armadillidium vulgare]